MQFLSIRLYKDLIYNLKNLLSIIVNKDHICSINVHKLLWINKDKIYIHISIGTNILKQKGEQGGRNDERRPSLRPSKKSPMVFLKPLFTGWNFDKNNLYDNLGVIHQKHDRRREATRKQQASVIYLNSKRFSGLERRARECGINYIKGISCSGGMNGWYQLVWNIIENDLFTFQFIPQ